MVATPKLALTHPLDPLTADEITRAAAIVEADSRLSPDHAVITIQLAEPPKDVVRNHRPGGPWDRQAFVIVRDRTRRATCEATVSLESGAILSWREPTLGMPRLTLSELIAADEVIRAHPGWLAAVRKRGADPELAIVDTWPSGAPAAEDTEGQRIVRALTWIRKTAEGNGYARPVEGLMVIFDLDQMQVTRIDDFGIVPLPENTGDFTSEGVMRPANVPHFESLREGPKPIEITQPEGVSFAVDGNLVTWQKWSFRLGFTLREGIVLHQLGYEDKGRIRPILYRAALSEMVVPYGDTAPTHWWKNAFDSGELGVGMLANSLELGCDCLGVIHYFDAVLSEGPAARTIPNAICMHEEDYGILWKHQDINTGITEVRRSRRLVISTISTIGNYEYGFFWYLYLDGTVQVEVKLTGIMSTGAIQPTQEPRFGVTLAPGLYAPNHQHWFNFRLDMEVDGPRNRVYQVDSVPVPLGPENPNGNAWEVQSTLLEREGSAAAQVQPQTARYWKFENPSSRNFLGNPVAYKLVPGENAWPMAHPDANVSQRAGFMANHFWATSYDPAEIHAAGEHINQHPGGDGLPRWVQQDRSLVDGDVVAWYSVCSHHIARLEDWPITPVAYCGFSLKPLNFFDGNPALDIPASANGHCHDEG